VNTLPVTLPEKYQDINASIFFDNFSAAALFRTLNKSIGTFITFISKSILTMIFFVFILVSRKVLKRKEVKILQESSFFGDDKVNIVKNISEQVRSYLLIKTAISVCTGAAFGLAAFLLGLDFALTWGILAFALNYIPAIGPIIASIPAILLAFIQFENPGYSIFASVVLAGIQFASGSLIEPRIMGDRLNLNIFALLLSLFLWGLIWGIPGMLLALPIMVSVNIIFANIPKLEQFSLFLSK
jgi:predicted PurR-regulated permease PerM